MYRHMLPGHTDAGRRAALDVRCSDTPATAWKNVAAGSRTVSKSCDGAALHKNLALAPLGVDHHTSHRLHKRERLDRTAFNCGNNRSHRQRDDALMERSVGRAHQVHPDESIDKPALDQVNA